MLSFILYHWGPPKMWNWNQIWASHFRNLAIFLLLGFSSSLLWSERRCMIYIYLNVSKFFFYSPKCDPRPMWTRECVSVLVGRTAPQMSLHPADWWCCWVQLRPYWFSAGWIWALLQRGVPTSPAKQWILLFFLAVLSASASCCDILLLGTHMLRIIIYSWLIDFFIIMQCFS